MNTTQLECFVRVAETLSFLGAAQQLHISQPAVSKQIRSLEDEVGAKLFLRTTHSCTLTPEGAQLLKNAMDILRLTYQARQDISTAAFRAGTLRIGYSDSHEMVRLYPVLRQMARAVADFDPVLCMGSWDANVSRLLRREIDLCFTFERNIKINEEIRFKPLTGGRLICVVPEGHPLAEGETVDPAAALAWPQVICVPDALKNEYHSGAKLPAFPEGETQRTVLCSTASEAYTLVLAGMGYCLLPEHVIVPHPELRFLPWPIPVSMVHGLAWRDPATSLMRRFIAEVAKLSTVP